MAKFRVRLRIENFELEIDGEREEDMPLITQAVGNQIAGLLIPATDIVEGETSSEADSQLEIQDNATKTSVKKPKSRKKSRGKVNNSTSKVEVPSWRHDPAKWGTPQQSWSASTKAIWILYVVSQEVRVNELSASQIASTFNEHFRQAKTIRTSTVTRDLGNLKTKANSFVSEDTSKSPSTWYLTLAGEAHAKELISKLLSANSS